MDSAGEPPFAPELVDPDPAFELVVERRELGRRAPASPEPEPADSPPFAPELIIDRPPHLEEFA